MYIRKYIVVRADAETLDRAAKNLETAVKDACDAATCNGNIPEFIGGVFVLDGWPHDPRYSMFQAVLL